MRLDGKIALITEASTPQAQAQARLFTAEGATVALIHDGREDVADLLGTLGGAVATEHIVNPLDEAGWQSVVDEVTSDHGRIDILVNNGGAATAERIPDLSRETWEHVLDQAVTAAFLAVRAVLPVMQRQQAGSIVNVTTIAAQAPPRGISEAQASIAGALRILAKDITGDYAHEGIRANSIHAGLVDDTLLGVPDLASEHVEAMLAVTPMRRTGTHREIANAALFLASDDASYITGTELIVDGGYVSF